MPKKILAGTAGAAAPPGAGSEFVAGAAAPRGQVPNILRELRPRRGVGCKSLPWRTAPADNGDCHSYI